MRGILLGDAAQVVLVRIDEALTLDQEHCTPLVQVRVAELVQVAARERVDEVLTRGEDVDHAHDEREEHDGAEDPHEPTRV
jgi:hypothetical protein